MAKTGRVAERPLGGPGFDVVEKAARAIQRYGMFEPGDAVLVALSGGPDSTCLFDVLRRLSAGLNLKLGVAHVDHGLNERSSEVAARVSHAGAAAGFDVHLFKAPDLAGPNLHARARDLRYAFFTDIAADLDATVIATGHTLDDRVETTMARLIHGAGTRGLAGIAPREAGRAEGSAARVRPLIWTRRTETRAYCDACGLEYEDDPANEDTRFERVAVRREILGAIEERWGDGAIKAMAASSERLSEDAGTLDDMTSVAWEAVAASSEAGTSLDRVRLMELPRSLRRRILERAIGRVRDRNAGIDEVLDALEDRSGVAIEPGKRWSIASGMTVEAHPEHFEITMGPPDEPPVTGES
ncbi:MAG TPA: tRNA lysidine(34) synthetase TilS [Actinomycetota bacterium]|nr:tRNA lysidine(34) synthetase TilS [Actinomycetota bacterium]